MAWKLYLFSDDMKIDKKILSAGCIDEYAQGRWNFDCLDKHNIKRYFNAKNNLQESFLSMCISYDNTYLLFSQLLYFHDTWVKEQKYI